MSTPMNRSTNSAIAVPHYQRSRVAEPRLSFSQVVSGKPLNIGSGFNALAYRERDYSCMMDPLVMVDHYTMTEPTFGAHPHAGLSAVSLLFEDSKGLFHNRDTLGNDFDLAPGDLYWLKAGGGVIHDESPRPGARVHGLQIFVNLPSSDKRSSPKSLHIKASSVPIYKKDGSRVRVLLGSSNGMRGQQSPALPLTILDGSLDSNSSFSHTLNQKENAWVLAIKGALTLKLPGKEFCLAEGQSMALSQAELSVMQTLQLENSKEIPAHFALLAGQPIAENFVQKGPFVMNSEADIKSLEADYAAGKFGRLE